MINNANDPSRNMIFSRIIEYGLLGLLIFAPLPAASVYEWSILVIQLAVLVMLAAYILMVHKPRIDGSLRLALKWPKFLFLGFLIFAVIQFVPFPKFLVRIFSPAAYAYQQLNTVEFSRLRFLSFSLIPSFTFQRFLEVLTYFIIGFLVLRTVTRRHQFIRIYSVLIAVGVFEAFYGMYELFNNNPRILFYRKVHNLDSVTGTFVNRNHLSGYLEMIIPLAIGLAIAQLDLFSIAKLTLRDKLLRLSEKGVSTNILLFFAVILMAVAVIFSKSRSGVFILVFSFILFFGLVSVYFNIYVVRKNWVKNFLRAAFLGIVFISLYVGIDAMLQRFSFDKLLQEQRPTYWVNTMRTFADYPLFGTGLGTFGALYPNLEAGEAGPVVLVHAHNDYLEYLSELGAVGFGFLLGGILYMAIVSFIVWRRRGHPEVKGLALGGIIAIFGILIHSITDFNLHIPANMVLFAVVLPLTMAVTFYKQGETPPEKK